MEKKSCLRTIYKLLGLSYAHFECIKKRVDTEEKIDHDIGDSSTEPSGSDDQAKINKSTGQGKF